jgi:hypothetical protein
VSKSNLATGSNVVAAVTQFLASVTIDEKSAPRAAIALTLAEKLDAGDEGTQYAPIAKELNSTLDAIMAAQREGDSFIANIFNDDA